MAQDKSGQGHLKGKPQKTVDTGTWKMVGNIWGVALGLSVALATYYRMDVTDIRYRTFSSADMIDVGGAMGGFTTLFCETVRVHATEKFDAYRLQHAPEIDLATRNFYNFSNDLFWGVGIKKRSFYLLSGSMINVTACIREDRHHLSSNTTLAKAFVFKGDDSFDNWKKSKNCDSCALQVHSISADMVCIKNRSLKFSLSVKETGNFYFAYNFTDSPEVYKMSDVQIFYQLSLARYDLAPATVMCKGRSSCVVTLDYATNQDVVLDFGERGESRIFVDSTCNTRVFYWVLMFVIIPVSVATLLSCICCCLCRTPSNKKQDRAINAKIKDKSSGSDGMETIYSTTGSENASTSVNIDSFRLEGYNTVYSTPESTGGVNYNKW